DARAHAIAHHPVETITPFVEEREGVRWLCIPRDAGYPVSEERLDRLRRA
ncbi:MAG: NUDIX hydrolase, partial [Sphingomonadaceae bacterium]|nr:NUDIX hydrolase [Sphingomonadaceae bacterium]